MRKNKKAIENIGTVAIGDLKICEGSIGLYMPIKHASEPIQKQLDKLEGWYKEMFAKKHPEIDTSKFTLNFDTALHMDLNTEGFIDRQETNVSYSINVIIWYEESANTEYEEVEFYDPFEIDINAEDSRYLKKLVINKLLDIFF